MMLAHRYECLAVPLPPSFQHDVESAVERLPCVSVVLQREPLSQFSGTKTDFETGAEDDNDDDELPGASYVPIDPCQPVIAALRIARQERMVRAFIDIETDRYIPREASLPDPYALKRVRPEQFAAAVLPALPAPEDEDQFRRIHWMANELHRLSAAHTSVLCLCNIMDWPWLRDAFNSVVERPPEPAWSETPTETFGVSARTLTFMLGELPFITGLYERARFELDDDENLSIDGIKSLLLHARDRYKEEFKSRARRITPQLLMNCV
jgi:hypothetical protein